MSNSVVDPIFGTMEFNYGWCKEEEIEFFGKTYSVEVLAEAEMGQPIFEEQRKLYDRFKGGIKLLSEDALSALTNFYVDNYPCVGEEMEDPFSLPEPDALTDELLVEMITPKTIFFPQDDMYAVLCDCTWEPANGIAIIVTDGEISIGTQDEII